MPTDPLPPPQTSATAARREIEGANISLADLPLALGMNKQRPSPSLHRALALCFSLLPLTGCTHAMSSTPVAQHTVNGNLLPLRFKIHSFEAVAYNTIKCSVLYDNHEFTPFATDTPTSRPPSADYRDHWNYAFYLGVRNFPGPAKVSWTSLDGTSHTAAIDLAQIFRDERVLTKVPDDEFVPKMYPQGLFLDPSIYLEVNDRTISVYMRALIPTQHRQVPDNEYSDARDDVILAWTHTY
ncbi:MAG TPA: hypothetical protein VFW82_13375 [Dyella sp.]|nr:hypothetical protein [Dyella sp.]